MLRTPAKAGEPRNSIRPEAKKRKKCFKAVERDLFK
jgi:hypothetical protein